jgi:hypothetical protein
LPPCRAFMRPNCPRDRSQPQRRHRQDKPPGPIAAQGCDRQPAGAKACGKACAPEDCKDLAPKASAPEHLRPACADGGIAEAAAACRRHPHLQWARMRAVRAQPEEMPLANQQPGRRRLLLLWERASQRTTLLPGARAHRVSVGRSTVQQRGCVSGDCRAASSNIWSRPPIFIGDHFGATSQAPAGLRP